MNIKRPVRLLAMAALLAACEGPSDNTSSYLVSVTGIELVQKGGSQTLAVDGLPSASGTLIQPRRGRSLEATK